MSRRNSFETHSEKRYQRGHNGAGCVWNLIIINETPLLEGSYERPQQCRFLVCTKSFQACFIPLRSDNARRVIVYVSRSRHTLTRWSLMGTLCRLVTLRSLTRGTISNYPQHASHKIHSRHAWNQYILILIPYSDIAQSASSDFNCGFILTSELKLGMYLRLAQARSESVYVGPERKILLMLLRQCYSRTVCF